MKRTITPEKNLFVAGYFNTRRLGGNGGAAPPPPATPPAPNP